VLNKPKDPESSQGRAGTAADMTGLTSEDLAALGGLAAKVGGVSNLIRILEVWHETPK
jgi:hypothetical protein